MEHIDSSYPEGVIQGKKDTECNRCIMDEYIVIFVFLLPKKCSTNHKNRKEVEKHDTRKKSSLEHIYKTSCIDKEEACESKAKREIIPKPEMHTNVK